MEHATFRKRLAARRCECRAGPRAPCQSTDDDALRRQPAGPCREGCRRPSRGAHTILVCPSQPGLLRSEEPAPVFRFCTANAGL